MKVEKFLHICCTKDKMVLAEEKTLVVWKRSKLDHLHTMSSKMAMLQALWLTTSNMDFLCLAKASGFVIGPYSSLSAEHQCYYK